LSKEKVPMKIVVPIIVVTWILSLVSSLAIIYSMPSLVPVKLADGAIVTVKMADGSVTSAKILDGSIAAVDLANGTIITVKIADGNVTTEKMADGAITNTKLAANAIPFASTYNFTGPVSTTSKSYADIPDMSVSITLARTSHVLIMFSCETKLDASGDYLLARAMVDSTPAFGPTAFALTSETDYSVRSQIWYMSNLSAGSYTVKIQWRMFLGTTTGYAWTRTLSVIALPA